VADMRPGQLEPNDFEVALLRQLADREPEIRASLNRLHVLSREFTGVGCFTKFVCEESGDTKSERQVGLKALIRVPSVPNGMGAVLFCKGDQPKLLEVFTYGNDHWDGEYDGFSIEGSCDGEGYFVGTKSTR